MICHLCNKEIDVHSGWLLGLFDNTFMCPTCYADIVIRTCEIVLRHNDVKTLPTEIKEAAAKDQQEALGWNLGREFPQ